jgi:hypothetical protein
MRHITKPVDPPKLIQDWLNSQLSISINVSYEQFDSKNALCIELTKQQFGLCAYTGMPIDQRLCDYNNDSNFKFRAHNEHVKPIKVCKDELKEKGGIYNRDLCEDMDHRNIVAALEVTRIRPSRAEIFGATAHGDELLQITPLQPDCEEKFQFDENGGVHGSNDMAIQTISLLKLDHPTLMAWRRGAIMGFFPLDINLSKNELEELIDELDQPKDDKLPEFSFCIRSYAKLLLGN